MAIVGHDYERPLHLAAENATDPAVIEILLDAGAGPMALARNHETPLHRATRGNADVAIVDLPINAGAAPVALDGSNSTPLHSAAHNENPAAVELLLAAEVVVVPHHGGATSSSAALVKAVSPQYAVVSAGHLNHCGFPKPQVVERWQTAGAAILSTGDASAVRVILKPGEPIHVQGWRHRQRRYRDG